MLAYQGGAAANHVQTNDDMFYVPGRIGAIAWIGLYLHNPKPRSRVPLVAE
ncbi:hypothetical protein [Paludisphaera soli]|uniref:hypothetical protein n=1 Tax=Paludisphaera soli TaxID=2712865 RepID=UPI001F0F436A|nr:hypothetical protein [Paludisphaera soli]